MIKKIILLLTSVKLTVLLIFLLAALSLIGVFVPQVPSDLSASIDGFQWWTDNVLQDSFGIFTSIFSTLGFFDIFHSFWFLGSSFLLLCNILFCTLKRARGLKEELETVRLNSNPEFYNNGRKHSEISLTLPVKSAMPAIAAKLKKLHYSFARDTVQESVFFAAEKYRFSALGTYAIHLSLMLFIVGILVGSIFGFRNDSFIVAENTTQEVGFDTGLSLSMGSFADEYWENGTPKDYRSEVTLLKDSVEVSSGVIRVNHPLVYQGIRFHQSVFGPAIALKISDSNGKLIYDGSLALADMTTSTDIQRPSGEIRLVEKRNTVVVIGSSTHYVDPVLQDGQIGIELYDKNMAFINWVILDQNKPLTFEDMTFTFTGESQYSGFMVSKDPGSIFIWIASCLFLIGLLFSLYLPHRKLWIALSPSHDNGTTMRIRLDSKKEFGLQNELTDLADLYKILENKEKRS